MTLPHHSRQAWISTGFSLRSMSQHMPPISRCSANPSQKRALSSSPVVLEERDSTAPAGTPNADRRHGTADTTHAASQSQESLNDIPDSNASKSKNPETLKDIFPDLFGKTKPLPPRFSIGKEKRKEWEKTLEQSMTDSAAMIDTLPRSSRGPRSPATPAAIGSTISSIFDMGSNSNKSSTGVAPPARMGVKAGVKDRTRAVPKELQAFHELLESMFEASEAQAAEIGRQRRGISNRRDNSGFGMDKHLAPRDSYLSDVFDGGRRPDRRDPTAQREDYDNRSQTTTIAKPIGNMKNVSDRDMDDYMQKRESIASFRTDLDVLEWLNRTYYMPAASPAQTNNDKGSEASISSAFTPSYPLVLAYAISVLHLSFRNPHAALAVFETARSHSLESYLVGCTTSVYNQMLRARWEGLGDLKGTEEGLEEMERRGVGWDKETMEFANTLMGNLIKPSLRRLSIGLGNGPVSKETTAFIDQRLVWAYGPDVLERRARLEQMIENQVEFSERGVRIQMKRRVDELRERKGRDGSRYGDHTPGDDRWVEYREPEPRWV